MAMLTQGDPAFVEPTKTQRRNLAMAFAAEDRIVYGFRFLLIHTLTGHRMELTLQDLFKEALSIYPSWSVRF